MLDISGIGCQLIDTDGCINQGTMSRQTTNHVAPLGAGAAPPEQDQRQLRSRSPLPGCSVFPEAAGVVCHAAVLSPAAQRERTGRHKDGPPDDTNGNALLPDTPDGAVVIQSGGTGAGLPVLANAFQAGTPLEQVCAAVK